MQTGSMEQIATFPRPRISTLPSTLSRVSKEDALRTSLRRFPVAAPGAVSYPLGLAMGIFSAHMGHVAGQLLTLGMPGLVVSVLVTLLLVTGFLALLRQRDRWVLGLAGLGAFAGLVAAPLVVGPYALQLLVTLCQAIQTTLV